MSTPRMRLEPPVAPLGGSQPQPPLDNRNTEPTQHLREAELNLAIESAASRLLGFALTREGEELYAEADELYAGTE